MCHYTLYLHETLKTRGGRSLSKATGGEDALVHVQPYNQRLLGIIEPLSLSCGLLCIFNGCQGMFYSIITNSWNMAYDLYLFNIYWGIYNRDSLSCGLREKWGLNKCIMLGEAHNSSPTVQGNTVRKWLQVKAEKGFIVATDQRVEKLYSNEWFKILHLCFPLVVFASKLVMIGEGLSFCWDHHRFTYSSCFT